MIQTCRVLLLYFIFLAFIFSRYGLDYWYVWYGNSMCLFFMFFWLLLMTWFFRWRNIKEFHMIILVYKKYRKFVGICWFIRIQPSNRNSFIFFIFTETINIVRYYNLYLKMNGHFQIPVCFIQSKWFFSKEFQQFHFIFCVVIFIKRLNLSLCTIVVSIRYTFWLYIYVQL